MFTRYQSKTYVFEAITNLEIFSENRYSDLSFVSFPNLVRYTRIAILPRSRNLVSLVIGIFKNVVPSITKIF